MRLVELRLVGALGLHVTHHAPESLVNDERRLAAGTRDFVFGSQCRHKVSRDSATIIVTCPRDWVDVRVATYNIHRARGLDRRTRPERIAARARRHRAGYRRASGSDRPGPRRARDTPNDWARRSAWAGSWRRRANAAGISSATPSSAGSPSANTRASTSRGRPASRAAASASRSISATSVAAGLQRPPRHGAARAPLSGARARSLGPRPPRDRPEDRPRRLQRMGARASSRTCWPRGSQSIDLFPFLKPPPHLSRASSPSCTSTTSTSHGEHRSPARRTPPDTPRAVASDHLPLVADIRVHQ